MARNLNGNRSSGQEGEKDVVPKTEVLDYELPACTTFSRNVGDNVASSSESELRASFIGMGFLPSLVDKVIEENGGDDTDVLLETLLTLSALQNSDSPDSLDGSLYTRRGRSGAPNFCTDGHSEEGLQISHSQSSDSLDSLFNDKDPPEVSTVVEPKEELDEFSEVSDDKRASLLMMNFSLKEVEFAIHKLGEDASLNELVNFIVAAQIAEKFGKETDDIASDNIKNEVNSYLEAGVLVKSAKGLDTEDALSSVSMMSFLSNDSFSLKNIYSNPEDKTNNEKLFGTMEKTLQLLEMGFSESEVSSAIERLGSEFPISELANCIFALQSGINYVPEYKYPSASTSCSLGIKNDPHWHLHGTAEVKTENISNDHSQLRNANFEEIRRGKRVKEECDDEIPDAVFSARYSSFEENHIGKRPKQEYYDDFSSSFDPYWVEEKVDANIAELSTLNKSNPSRSLNRVVAKPPFFFYGNISNISYDSWKKISQFLYALEPEFVNTQFFSALSRREGYVHNLPAENRFHIVPRPPMTIEDAIPHTKKWWASWDSRKQLSCINCESSGVLQLCDRLGRMLADSGGVLTSEQQKNIIHHCRTLNLIWIGKYKLGPVEPEQWELILGYPLNHTRAAESSTIERIRTLKYCFQTDTLGYHLSVLKPMFPGGLTVLSVFSGIGGAEVALHRLGIKMKAVVSVETSEAKRKILRRWWHNSGQTGELVQIEDIQKLTSNRLESLIKKFGGFDLVICQNPHTYTSPRTQAAETVTAFDFSLFYEFVRVLQRVRSLCERR